jgi:amino acid transporter
MAQEQLAFARKASGLTRGLSMQDVLGMGLIDTLPLYGIWFMFSMGLAVFSGANLFIAVAITAVTLGVASPIIWGVLSGSMPRSGGDYIYNSRILIPVIALAGSMGYLLGQVYWNIYMATWITQPSLQMLGQFLGWSDLVTFAESKWGTFACAVLLFAAAFSIVAFGMKVFQRIQRPIVLLTTVATALCFLPLLFTSRSGFIENWNEAAAKYGSLDYQSFIRAAEQASGSAITGAWNWPDTIGALTATFMLVIYCWAGIYVSGEVKNPSKAMMTATAVGGFIVVALAFLFLFGAYHAADSRFLIAAAYNDWNGGVEGYTFPYSSGVMGLCFVGSGFNPVIAWLLSMTWLLSTISIFAVIMTMMVRVLFAWGMDRMGPKWWTSVSPRFATPIKPLAFVAIVSCAFTAVYILWLQSALTGLVASGMILVTTFLLSAISAVIFPFRKKVRGIWESSPYRTWKLAGIPVVTLGGILYLAFLAVLIYYAFLSPKTRDITGKSLFLFAAVWVFGIVWYLFWKWRSAKQNVDVGITFGELPPE